MTTFTTSITPRNFSILLYSLSISYHITTQQLGIAKIIHTQLWSSTINSIHCTHTSFDTTITSPSLSSFPYESLSASCGFFPSHSPETLRFQSFFSWLRSHHLQKLHVARSYNATWKIVTKSFLILSCSSLYDFSDLN